MDSLWRHIPRLICHLCIKYYRNSYRAQCKFLHVWSAVGGMTEWFRGFPTCFVSPQKSGGALFSHLPHLFSIPMKRWNIFRQSLPLIRLAQMGHRRWICLKQKRTLTVRRKKNPHRGSPHCPHPHLHQHPHPSVPAEWRRTRAASVPPSFGKLYRPADNIVFLVNASPKNANLKLR